uniref:Uncharacterized protein n=1 Tax=Physcomitrium patens TaxID=3218 RepID=A0A2K1J4W7_PHYPA|nr:hypothetical protein PHYPA_022425 [Physcomitrium patens]
MATQETALVIFCIGGPHLQAHSEQGLNKLGGACSLFHLYNVLENPYGRFLIFKRVLKLAVAGKVTELIVPIFKRMDAFSHEWNISESDKRDIFLSATNILKDQKGRI